MFRRIFRFVWVPVAVLVCGSVFVGCPDDGDGSGWQFAIHGDANPGSDTSGGGLHAVFHWDL